MIKLSPILFILLSLAAAYTFTPFVSHKEKFPQQDSAMKHSFQGVWAHFKEGLPCKEPQTVYFHAPHPLKTPSSKEYKKKNDTCFQRRIITSIGISITVLILCSFFLHPKKEQVVPQKRTARMKPSCEEQMKPTSITKSLVTDRHIQKHRPLTQKNNAPPLESNEEHDRKKTVDLITAFYGRTPHQKMRPEVSDIVQAKTKKSAYWQKKVDVSLSSYLTSRYTSDGKALKHFNMCVESLNKRDSASHKRVMEEVLLVTASRSSLTQELLDKLESKLKKERTKRKEEKESHQKRWQHFIQQAPKREEERKKAQKQARKQKPLVHPPKEKQKAFVLKQTRRLQEVLKRSKEQEKKEVERLNNKRKPPCVKHPIPHPVSLRNRWLEQHARHIQEVHERKSRLKSYINRSKQRTFAFERKKQEIRKQIPIISHPTEHLKKWFKQRDSYIKKAKQRKKALFISMTRKNKCCEEVKRGAQEIKTQKKSVAKGPATKQKDLKYQVHHKQHPPPLSQQKSNPLRKNTHPYGQEEIPKKTIEFIQQKVDQLKKKHEVDLQDDLPKELGGTNISWEDFFAVKHKGKICWKRVAWLLNLPNNKLRYLQQVKFMDGLHYRAGIEAKKAAFSAIYWKLLLPMMRENKLEWTERTDKEKKSGSKRYVHKEYFRALAQNLSFPKKKEEPIAEDFENKLLLSNFLHLYDTGNEWHLPLIFNFNIKKFSLWNIIAKDSSFDNKQELLENHYKKEKENVIKIAQKREMLNIEKDPGLSLYSSLCKGVNIIKPIIESNLLSEEKQGAPSIIGGYIEAYQLMKNLTAATNRPSSEAIDEVSKNRLFFLHKRLLLEDQIAHLWHLLGHPYKQDHILFTNFLFACEHSGKCSFGLEKKIKIDSSPSWDTLIDDYIYKRNLICLHPVYQKIDFNALISLNSYRRKTQYLRSTRIYKAAEKLTSYLYTSTLTLQEQWNGCKSEVIDFIKEKRYKNRRIDLGKLWTDVALITSASVSIFIACKVLRQAKHQGLLLRQVIFITIKFITGGSQLRQALSQLRNPLQPVVHHTQEHRRNYLTPSQEEEDALITIIKEVMQLCHIYRVAHRQIFQWQDPMYAYGLGQYIETYGNEYIQGLFSRVNNYLVERGI